MNYLDWIIMCLLVLAIGVAIKGILHNCESATVIPTCENITIIETKEQECVLLPIPNSKAMDGIPDNKIYCVDQGSYSALQ